MSERSEQESVRFQKLEELKGDGFQYPNNSKPSSLANAIIEAEAQEPEDAQRYTLAGRIVQMRVMGKASFVHILDSSAKVQCYVRRDDVGEDAYKAFKRFDIGDIIEISGYVFVTKTGEKSLYAESVRLLTKALIPLPEKWHGLTDIEARYRYRYVDLIANPDVREVFVKRAKVIREVRAFLDGRGYLEVETPVLQTIAGGTSAKPFSSHYNALHADMFMRIALELPLKKLVVGGLERVYELGRVFRNEGLSKKHNPEFTMLEFYEAYATFENMMELTEQLISQLAKSVGGSHQLPFGDKEIDYTPPWPRMTMIEAVQKYGKVDASVDLSTLEGVQQVAATHNITLAEKEDWGRSLETLFDELAEPSLVNPVFITHHPFSISPLARKNQENEQVVDRFELFIASMEVANAFSELNDPVDQRERFEAQADRKAQGDEEAQDVDEDFLRALEYGMPPTGGEGIGIDRLVMLLTNAPTIRDVLLFPQLKPLAAGEDDGLGEAEVLEESPSKSANQATV